MRKLTLILLLVCLNMTALLTGQTITASITGTVTDPSGAVVTTAKVIATNASTGVTFEATSNQAGVYRLLFLPVGTYNLSVEGPGFRKYTAGPFALEVNQVARIDVSLQLGDTTQTVEVTGVAPILQTESTATGDTITSRKLSSLPLNGRNFASLTLLVPGAISTSPSAMNTSGRFQGSGSRPQVNGNREQTNNFLLDGVDVNDSIDNRIGYQPNVDALEEVRVLTGNGGGEFGNVGGASVVMSLKSGGNEFHGNLFEFLRNEKLDANGFFRNRSLNTAVRAPFRRNIFGGTLGGPIVRNKAFFFMDYEGTEQRSSGSATATVPPAEWRTGDLSQFLTQNQVVRDPATGLPFPGNIIPTSRISPVAQALFSTAGWYPLPNQPGTGPLGITNNFGGGTRNKLKNHQADAKVDYRLSDNDNLMGRWSIGRYESGGSQNPLPVQLPGITEGPTTSAVVNWTRTFSPRLVNDARIAFSRIVINDSVADWSGLLGTSGNQTLGIGGGQPIAGLSQIDFGTGLTTPGTGASISSTADNKYQAQTFLTYTTGGHLLKFGGQFIRLQQNRFYAGNNGVLGIFRFNGTYTGVAFADFLLNQMSGKGRGDISGLWGHRHWRNALFFQDDWKVMSSLTLNLGLRWEYITPIYEVADRQVNINTYTGQLLYAADDTDYGRALYKPYKKSFMPNLGFAWTPPGFNNKFVIRAGYRFSTFLEGTGANLRLPLNPPFFAETDITYDARQPGDIRTGFADTATVRPVLNGPRTGAAPALQARAWDLNLRPQFTNQFNAAMEYMVTNSTSVTAAYVGQRGTHLVVPHEANQPLPGTGPFSTWAPLNDRRPLANVLPNVSNIALTESSGTMWYNSLQVSGRQRMRGGLEFLVAYTLSKTLSDNLGYYGCGGVSSDGAYWQNAYDRRANYGPSCFDARHNFTIGGLYDLPVGKGRRFGGSNRALDLIAGGWNINYFLSAHSGFPVTVNAGAHQNNTGQSVRGNVRANYYRPMTVTAERTVDRWFGPVDNLFCTQNGVDNGTCAYGLPALGEFGSAGVGTERMPGYFNLDLSVGKKFYVTEKQYLDLRIEGFNALNFVSWGAPGRDMTSPATFGQITGQIGSPRSLQFGLKYHF